MAGCSIVALMTLIMAAGIAVLAAIFGATVFFLVLGILFLVLSFTVLKRKNELQKKNNLQMPFRIIGIFSLVLAAAGIFILGSVIIMSMSTP